MLLLELIIGNGPNTTTKTNKLLSYGGDGDDDDDDDDSVDPSKQTKIFMNFVYWNINPRSQPTKVTDLVYLPYVFCFTRKVWKMSSTVTMIETVSLTTQPQQINHKFKFS